MRFLVAAEDSGTLKDVVFIKGTDTSKKDGPEPTVVTKNEKGRKSCINRLLQLKNGQILSARKGGAVELYNDELEVTRTWILPTNDHQIINMIEVLSSTSASKVLIADNYGNIFIIDPSSEELSPVKLSLVSVERSKEDAVCAFVYSKEENLFAFGGNDVDLEVIKIDLSDDNSASISKVWKAKNVKNDKLDLKVPVWIRDIRILADGTQRIVTITHYGHIRVYDMKHGRRPIQEIKVESPQMGIKRSLNHMTKGPSESTIVVSDSHSSVEQFDLQKKGFTGKYLGPTGSVKAMCSNDYALAMGGLDRYLRVYDITTRAQLGKIFLGTLITAVLILEDDRDKGEGDELWDELEARATKKQKT